jgi:hypothetical protein
MRVAPRNGKIIIDPATSRPLPSDGDDVPKSSYWIRRLQAGDVISIEEQEAAAAKPRAQRRKRTKGTEEGR